MDTEQILDKCDFYRACAEMSRANHLALYTSKTKINNIPKLCEWCDWNCNWSDNLQNNIIYHGQPKNNIMYYFNSPSEHKLICSNCGEKVKTNNEDDDIIFCYKIDQS